MTGRDTEGGSLTGRDTEGGSMTGRNAEVKTAGIQGKDQAEMG